MTIILCETPDGCTCGAPASTPAGMHHCDCAVHPGWCGQAGCLPCEENGKVIPHGTLSGYTKHECRCDRCRLFWNAYQRWYRALRQGRVHGACETCTCPMPEHP